MNEVDYYTVEITPDYKRELLCFKHLMKLGSTKGSLLNWSHTLEVPREKILKTSAFDIRDGQKNKLSFITLPSQERGVTKLEIGPIADTADEFFFQYYLSFTECGSVNQNIYIYNEDPFFIDLNAREFSIKWKLSESFPVISLPKKGNLLIYSSWLILSFSEYKANKRLPFYLSIKLSEH